MSPHIGYFQKLLSVRAFFSVFFSKKIKKITKKCRKFLPTWTPYIKFQTIHAFLPTHCRFCLKNQKFKNYFGNFYFSGPGKKKKSQNTFEKNSSNFSLLLSHRFFNFRF
jgi:hypothetical protein